MTRFFTAVFPSVERRWSLLLILFLGVLSWGTVSVAQHHSGHFHSPGFGGVQHGNMQYGNGVGGFQTNGPATYGGPGLVQQFGGGGAYNNNGFYNGSGAYNGPYQYSYGGFNASAPLGGFNANAPLGGVSFGNGFGTASYSQRNFGIRTYGVSGSGFGGLNYGSGYGIGYGSPVIFSTPMYNYSPSVFGYGTGVFSPNFPSGNYISNGYIGFVPSGGYNAGGYAGWPYAPCINPYFAGTGIAPTVLLLNMNLNMQPVVPAATANSLVDPRIIDMLAPAPDPNAANFNGVEVPPVPHPPEPGGQPVLPDAPQLPLPTDGVPVLNEFNAIPRDQKISSLAEKIHSLRYQASGDDAFHKSDYATAEVFYATAIKTAPDRRAPYLRMAIVRIALADFPNAASYLKTGLSMESDPSRPWCTVEELYRQKVAERTRSHGGPLWNWLAERPLSADRLLLAGTFQKLRGYNKTADEMLALASHQGTEAILVTEVMQLAAADIGPRDVSDDLEQLVEQASAQQESSIERTREQANRSAGEKSGGIFLRGDGKASPTKKSDVSPPIVSSAPAAAEQAPVPIHVPVSERN